MITQPHIKTEGNSNFQIGELQGNTIFYNFDKIIAYLNIKGNLLFGNHFKIYSEDKDLIYKLCCYFIQDHETCKKLAIDPNKGILLTGPVGCGKTSLMKLLLHLAPHKTKFKMIATRNIVFDFNTKGFGVFDKYNQNLSYCFDDLGLEPNGKNYGEASNVMGEIILSRYDLYSGYEPNTKVKTHFTTNLNSDEIGKIYGQRVRSRLKSMVNLISFDSNTKDKRN